MANFLDWLMGGNANIVPPQQQNLNLLPPMPLQAMNGLNNPMMNNPMMSNPLSNPMGQSSMPGALQASRNATNPSLSPNPLANPNAQSPLSNQDSLRKMLMMQALMGGQSDPQNAISGGLPTADGLKGSGGFQNNPDVGLLNSMPTQFPGRRRFIGNLGNGY
jgi:hypothetical protein